MALTDEQIEEAELYNKLIGDLARVLQQATPALDDTNLALVNDNIEQALESLLTVITPI